MNLKKITNVLISVSRVWECTMYRAEVGYDREKKVIQRESAFAFV